jgi:virginiamycin B lyase
MVRMTTTGTMQAFQIPLASVYGLKLAVGADGNIWFTNTPGNKIGYITPAGKTAEFTVPQSSAAEPLEIIAGPGGTLWFTEFLRNKIGEFKLNG